MIRYPKVKLNNFYVLISILKQNNYNYYKNLPFKLLNKINIYKDNKIIRTITSDEYYNNIINNINNYNQYWKQNYMIELSYISDFLSIKNITFEVILKDYNLDNLDGDIKLEIIFNNIDGFSIIKKSIKYNQIIEDI
jgi:hypothetical protein